MKSRILLWLALVAGAGTAALAVAWAQGQSREEEPARSEYAYLPARYGEVYIPSVAEWQALQLTALCASRVRITKNFSREHLNCYPQRDRMIVTLDLVPEPPFTLYAGGGKFTGPPEKVKPALQEALDISLKTVRAFFPEIRDQDLQVRLYVQSELVGTWTAGTLDLTGER
ncbi:MAG: hypothetical protein HY320_04680 [Armatimonadetes bacterium]|nr:hypothetical protein [Armatimonadota bacterium]